MTPKIGILDFNPDKSPDLRQYPKRIGAFIPQGIEWEGLLFRDNPDISPYDALILSGSKLSATLYERMVEQGKIEGKDYEDIDAVVKTLSKYDKPMFGICFGAQLVAHFMGGKLGRLDKTEAGYLSHELTTEGKSDKVFGFLPKRFYGAHLHRDYVAELPCGVGRADVLATRNGHIHAFRVKGKNGIISYGVQPHPEMSTQQDATFLVNVNSHWLKDEIGHDAFEKALVIPQDAEFELHKTITFFVNSL